MPDLDFARSELSYRGGKSRRLCENINFSFSPLAHFSKWSRKPRASGHLGRGAPLLKMENPGVCKTKKEAKALLFIVSLLNITLLDFLGSPVVGTPCLQCRGARVQSLVGN